MAHQQTQREPRGSRWTYLGVVTFGGAAYRHWIDYTTSEYLFEVIDLP